MASSTAVAGGEDVVGPRTGGGNGGGGTTPQQQPPPPEQGLRCPRCDSPNTKFCYYNNYSLSQPRHFCKTCRRYWTKGGALRNVPIGGGCRKNKRSRSSVMSASAAVAAASSHLSLNLPVDGIGVTAASADQQVAARLGFLGVGAPVVSSPIGGTPAADYQGAAVGMMALPRINAPAVGHYLPFGERPSGPGVDITGVGGHAMSGGPTGAVPVSSNIASSIESLSFINQDLHWKLQQQRLATMILIRPPSSGAAVHVEGAATEHVSGPFMQMAGVSARDAVPVEISWFMDNSYVLPLHNTAAAIGNSTSNGNVNSGRSSADCNDRIFHLPFDKFRSHVTLSIPESQKFVNHDITNDQSRNRNRNIKQKTN